MHTVEQAHEIIQSTLHPLPVLVKRIDQAKGWCVAQPVYAPIPFPHFNQSDKDGYAIKYADLQNHTYFHITGESSAGSPSSQLEKSGQAFRIFTGAPMPLGADTVVMQEKTTQHNCQLTIHDTQLKQGSNVRLKGIQCKKGDLVLQRGTLLTPGAIAALASLGIAEIEVYNKPEVFLMNTGSELQEPGQTLHDSQIYNSNRYGLAAALADAGIATLHQCSVPDQLPTLKKHLAQALSGSTDLLLITGGVSVGDYDFVAQALAEAGVTTLIHTISQRPGKPFYLGIKDRKVIVGLPGNPVSALVCFYEYVVPILHQLGGYPTSQLKKYYFPISQTYPKKKGLSVYLQAIIQNNTVHPLINQESFRTHTFALAECLIYLPLEKENVAKGELVEVHLLPTTH